MRRLLSFCIIVFLAIGLHGQNNEGGNPNDHVVNFGFKAGFNSSMYIVSDFKLEDVLITDIQNNYRIGYFASVFMRLNFNNHFLQPELSYQVSKCKIKFDKQGGVPHPDMEPEYADINSKIHSIEVPILYGYNIIKKGPYGMSVFAGPKVKYLWNKHNKITFDNLNVDIEEELRPFNFSLTAGVAVSISRIFFDFRYELGLNNISKSINYINNTANEEKQTHNIAFDRKENLLSFSFGFMF